MADKTWQARFRAPALLWTQLARLDPSRGLVAANLSGVNQLYAWEVASGRLTQLTDRPEGLSNALLAPDGRYLFYLDDQGGNELGHYVRLPLDGGAPEDLTPDLPPYSSFGIAASRNGRLLAFMVTDAAGFHLYALDLRPDGTFGSPRPLYHAPGLTWGPTLSADGNLAVLDSTGRTGRPQYSLVAVATRSGERLLELWDGPQASLKSMLCSPVPGDYRLVAITNRTGRDSLLLWDPRLDDRTDLPLGDLDGSLRVHDWSADGRALLLECVSRAAQRLYLFDLVRRRLRPLDHPPGSYFSPYFGPDGDLFAHHQDATLPVRLVALDPASGALKRIVLSLGEPPPGRPRQSVTFPSSDGTDIQGWLALPDGAPPFPAILDLIGGPHEVATDSYSAATQMWLDHRFAVLTVNYRGNATFGRHFREQIWGQPGRLEVEDIVAARRWLLSAGLTVPDQIFLCGWSYGGFLALLTAGKEPGLWAGAIAGLAIADWTMAHDESADMIKGYLAALFGGRPAEKAAQYAAASPLTYVAYVDSPVLIIQGRRDSRTPARPVELYVERLRALGRPVEIHWFDAGHGGSGAQVEQSIAHHETMLRFAQAILGCQLSGGE